SAQRLPHMLEGGAPFSFADLVERVAPSVVTVTVDEKMKAQPKLPEQAIPAPFRKFFREMPHAQPSIAMGSGFIIDSSGDIVTNNHVVENARKITVKLKDGRKFVAKLLGTDPATDIALLKINAGKPLPAVQFANDRNVRVGDWVVAVGDPFGLSNTVTAGIVSSLGRSIGIGDYTDYIQIDAPINRGNSGGPAFDIEGKVIGMNTMIYSPSGGSVGIGFAIPSSTIHSIVAQLKAHGKVSRGWLGVEIQDFTPDMAASIGKPDLSGAIIAKVLPSSPASQAGFRQGDVVMAINGRSIRDSRALTRQVANIPAGQQARFTILRAGKTYTLTARIALRQPQVLARYTEPGNAVKPTLTAMGLGLSGVTPDLRRVYNLDARVDGVVITKVDPNADAADKGVEPGDVIVAIGDQKVRTPVQVQQAITRAKHLGRNSVLTLLMTQDGERFVALGIGQNS
ncbi:MAG: Do family serine endopeptidase, partial [Alphaproteobacteria bacterium]|nr:Do family serine endopeptidase [Alphaproteobacteria bacterium]